MYGIYLTILIIGVYLAPGIALFPKAVFDSRLAFAIPIVSVLIVTLAARLLKAAGLFTEPLVILTTLTLTTIAGARVWRGRRSSDMHWPEIHRLVYFFSVFAALPVAVKLGLSGFRINDEIYSWNMWAMQHLLGQAPDLSYVSAPYPQSFSLLIAWCYQLLGSVDLQLPVKAGFAVLSMSSIAAIGTASRRLSPLQLQLFLVLSIYLLYVMDVYETLATGLAEALMIPALVGSVALYLRAAKHPENTSLLLLSSATALCAALAKQQAMLWLMLALPLLTACDVLQRRRTAAGLWPVGIAWLGGLVWLLTEGSGFQNNEGVVSASLQGREILEQLVYSTQRHILGKPAFLVLLMLSAFAVHRGHTGRGVFWLLVIPALVLWLVFGTYNTRLGVHVMMLAALLLATNSYCVSADFDQSSRLGRVRLEHLRGVVLTLALLCVVYSALDVRTILEKRGDHFSLYDGPKNIIHSYFGQDGETVALDVFRTGALVWAPSAYIYGIFFHHNPVVRPDLTASGFGPSILRDQLLKERPDYVVDSGELAQYGRGTKVLRELIEHCDDAFKTVAEPPNTYDYTMYRVDYSKLQIRNCSP